MQYLADRKQEQNSDIDSWHFGHINRVRHDSWENKARKLRHRREKQIRRQERQLHRQLRGNNHRSYML